MVISKIISNISIYSCFQTKTSDSVLAFFKHIDPKETINPTKFLNKLRHIALLILFTAQKMKFSIKDFFSKCDKIRRKIRSDCRKECTVHITYEVWTKRIHQEKQKYNRFMVCFNFRNSLLLLKTGKPIPLLNTNLHSGALNLIRAQYRVVPPKDKLYYFNTFLLKTELW